jgi:hypothetical protein
MIDADGQGMSAAFIEQIRQKLGLNLQTLLTVTKAAATYLTPAQAAAAYQPLSTNIAKLVYKDGVLLVNPVVAVGTAALVSNGTTGPYTVPYGVTFTATPIVAISPEESTVNYVQISGAPGLSSCAVVQTGSYGAGTNFNVRFIAVGV